MIFLQIKVNNLKMVDDELRELLTDYKSMAESERSNFASQVVKNSSFANLVFNSLLAFEA